MCVAKGGRRSLLDEPGKKEAGNRAVERNELRNTQTEIHTDAG